VIAVVAAEASRRIVVAKIVRVRAPRHFEIGENVLIENINQNFGSGGEVNGTILPHVKGRKPDGHFIRSFT
jgi:hypothetical protein